MTCREYVKNGLDKFEALAGHNLAQLTIQPDELTIDESRPDAGAELITLQWRPATIIEDVLALHGCGPIGINHDQVGIVALGYAARDR